MFNNKTKLCIRNENDSVNITASIIISCIYIISIYIIITDTMSGRCTASSIISCIYIITYNMGGR